MVLDFLQVRYVVGFGEGAGANVLARFALANPSRVLGLILINCTGSAATVLDNFKTKVGRKISKAKIAGWIKVPRLYRRTRDLKTLCILWYRRSPAPSGIFQSDHVWENATPGRFLVKRYVASWDLLEEIVNSCNLF